MYPAKAIFSVISISLVHQWAKAFNIKRDVISINNTQQTTWKSLPTANQSYIRRLSVAVTFHQSETSSLRYNACFSIKRVFLICLNLANTKVNSNLTLRRTSSVYARVALILPITGCTLHSWSHSLRSLIIALSLSMALSMALTMAESSNQCNAIFFWRSCKLRIMALYFFLPRHKLVPLFSWPSFSWSRFP